MLSIIIPSQLEEHAPDVVNDILHYYPKAQVIVVTDRYRKGKGWAIREGLRLAKGRIVVFLDGDHDIHPKMIRRLMFHMAEFDIVVGKKDTRDNIFRYIVTLLSRLYIYIMFAIPVDTQTGIKAFRRDKIPDWECNSFAFDIEILRKAKELGYSMYEVTVEAKRSKPVKLISIWRTFIESIKILKGGDDNGLQSTEEKEI